MAFDFSDNRQRKRRIGMTPLVDVIFILIVFFMLVSSFSNFKSLNILPATVGGNAPVEILHLNLMADGTLLTRSGNTAEGALASAKAAGTALAVHVPAGISMQMGVDMLDRLKALGHAQVHLVAEGGE